MTKLLWLSLVDDERGGGTVMGLMWFMLLVGICGLAVDSTDGFRIKTGLQVTADASALAASIDLPDENMAYGNAMLYASLNMPSAQYGSVLQAEDVKFGVWDPVARNFTVGATPADAVRVRVHRSIANGNALSMNFLRIVGLSAWNDITAEAIAQRFIPPCLNDGLFARQIVNISSNNAFVERICVHGEEGVDMQNANSFELGTTVSMPDPATMLTMPTGGMESNPGLPDALKANSYNFAMIDDLPNIFYKLLHPNQDNGEVSVVPDYVSGDPKNYDTNYTVEGLGDSDVKKISKTGDGQLVNIPTDKGEQEIWKIDCNWNETYVIPPNTVLTNIVIVADCNIHVGSGAVLNDVVLASTAVMPGSNPLDYQNVTFAADVQLGAMDDCAPGGGVQIYSAASVHFSSSMMINGLQVVAAGNVELGARDYAVKGISVQAGKNITLTANNMFGLCSGGTPATLTGVSYRLVN